jgi:hypothetical protein
MVWEKTTMAKMNKLIFAMRDFSHLQSTLRWIAPYGHHVNQSNFAFFI